MTSLDTIRDSLPDYARDLRLNLGSVLTTTGVPGLTERQIWPLPSLRPLPPGTCRWRATSKHSQPHT
jgi:hypothetical protein